LNTDDSLIELLHIIKDYDFEDFCQCISEFKKFPSQSLGILYEILNKRREERDFYKYILTIISHIEEIPENLPEGFYKFIKNRLDAKEDDYFFILKCAFLLNEEAFFIFDSILKDKNITLPETVECFCNFSKIKEYSPYFEIIEDMAIRELKPGINFLLFKWTASCLKGTMNPKYIKKLINLIDLDSPYDKVVIEILATIMYPENENIIKLLSDIFSKKKILNNREWLFSILDGMEKRLPKFREKLFIFLKNWFEKSKNFKKEEIDLEKSDTLNIIDYYFSNYQNKELFSELKNLLKVNDNVVFNIVAKKYLNIVAKLPEKFQPCFKNVLKIKDRRKKINFYHALSRIKHLPNKNNFFDILLFLKIIEKYGDATFVSILKECVNITKDEHLIALIIKIIGKFKINSARNIIEKYYDFNGFTVIGNIVWTLGKLDFKEKINEISRFLEHDNDWIRTQAWISLRSCNSCSISKEKILNMISEEKFPLARIEKMKTCMKFFHDLDTAKTMLGLCKFTEGILEVLYSFKNDIFKLLDDIPDIFSEIREYFIKPESIVNFYGNRKIMERLLILFPDRKALRIIIKYYTEDKKYLLNKVFKDSKAKEIIKNEITNILAENCR